MANMVAKSDVIWITYGNFWYIIMKFQQLGFESC